MKRSTVRFNLYFLLGIVFIIGVWKILSLVMKSGIIFPPPEQVFLVFIKKLPTVSFWKNTGISALRVTEGFLLSLMTGIAAGILCGSYAGLNSFMKPFISLVRVVPVLSIILIAVIWLDSPQVPVFVSFLMAFPIITGNTIEGMNSRDRKLDQMAEIYGLEKKARLVSVTIPQLFPFISAAVKTSLGLTWKVVIAAEILSLPRYGIGSAMQNSQLQIETADVFSWTVAAVAVSALFELAARLIMTAFDWRKKSGQA